MWGFTNISTHTVLGSKTIHYVPVMVTIALESFSLIKLQPALKAAYVSALQPLSLWNPNLCLICNFDNMTCTWNATEKSFSTQMVHLVIMLKILRYPFFTLLKCMYLPEGNGDMIVICPRRRMEKCFDVNFRQEVTSDVNLGSLVT